MAKKKAKKKKTQTPKKSKEQVYLEMLIVMSKRQITNDDTELDRFFKYQVARLEKQLADLK